MKSLYIIYGCGAGFFGSLGSTFAKLISILPYKIESQFWSYNLLVVLLLGLILTNIYGVTLFAKSLEKSVNSLGPTLLSTSVNFATSTCFGVFLFNEKLALLRWFGISLILIGIVILFFNDKNKSVTNSKRFHPKAR